MNRSLFLRDMFMPLILECDAEEFQNKLIHYLSAIHTVYLLKSEYITDDMIECIPRSEWVEYFKEHYNLFSLFNQNKTWEPKKIRWARKIFEQWSGQGVLEN